VRNVLDVQFIQNSSLSFQDHNGPKLYEHQSNMPFSNNRGNISSMTTYQCTTQNAESFHLVEKHTKTIKR